MSNELVSLTLNCFKTFFPSFKATSAMAFIKTPDNNSPVSVTDTRNTNYAPAVNRR